MNKSTEIDFRDVGRRRGAQARGGCAGARDLTRYVSRIEKRVLMNRMCFTSRRNDGGGLWPSFLYGSFRT